MTKTVIATSSFIAALVFFGFLGLLYWISPGFRCFLDGLIAVIQALWNLAIMQVVMAFDQLF